MLFSISCQKLLIISVFMVELHPDVLLIEEGESVRRRYLLDQWSWESGLYVAGLCWRLPFLALLFLRFRNHNGLISFAPLNDPRPLLLAILRSIVPARSGLLRARAFGCSIATGLQVCQRLLSGDTERDGLSYNTLWRKYGLHYQYTITK